MFATGINLTFGGLIWLPEIYVQNGSDLEVGERFYEELQGYTKAVRILANIGTNVIWTIHFTSYTYLRYFTIQFGYEDKKAETIKFLGKTISST